MGARFSRRALAVGTLIDAIAVVAQTSGGASYGSLRLWAAIGWGLAAVGMGAGVDRWGFSSVFIAYGIGTGLSSALVVACFENPKPRRPDAAAAPASPRASSSSLRCRLLPQLLRSRLSGGLRRELSAALCGDGVALHAELVLGLLILIAAVFEIPVFLYFHASSSKSVSDLVSIWGATALRAKGHRLRDARAVREINARVLVVCVTGAISVGARHAMMWSAAVSKS